jgi:pimeloyl-ACP methyl ester carboxylesterase
MVSRWGFEQLVLIGLSMGAMNAMAFAIQHPEQVRALVVVDIRPAVNREKLPSRELDRYISEHGHPTFDDQEAAFRARASTHPLTAESAVRHHILYQTKRLDDGRWTFKHDPRISYFWSPRNLWSELGAIRAPTLIVRGGQSQVLPMDQAEQMQETIPNAQLVTIAGAAHTVPEDAPEQFNRAVGEFLAGL